MIAWRLCKAIFSEYKNGFLKVAGELLGKDASGRTFETIFPLGLIARPKDPNMVGGKPTKGGGLLLGFLGSDGFAIPTQDPRGVANVPELEKGSTALYCGKKTFLKLDGVKGSAMLYVANADESGAGCLSFDVEADNVQLIHSSGANVTMQDGGVVMSASDGEAWIQIKNGGEIVIAAATVAILGGVSVGDPVTAQPVLTGNPPGTPSTKLKASI